MKTKCPRCNHPTVAGQTCCVACGRPLSQGQPLLPKPKPAKKRNPKAKRQRKA